MVRNVYFYVVSIPIWLLFLVSCKYDKPENSGNHLADRHNPKISEKKIQSPKTVKVNKNITVGEYFEYMDSLVKNNDSAVPYPLSEHLIARHNPWIIDTLANTDYYRMMAKDSFVYDQRKMIVLPKGSLLNIPDSLSACRILENFQKTEIDVNIPEYKLRVYEDSILLYTFPIRVGQNRNRYLKFGNRITDLRTKSGTGTIINHVKHPDFYNPVDGKKFYLTKRDDGKTTLMPQIPWIETEINGIRNGQMIHPTTNPVTLEKAYSNGCIGTKEADAWLIYYYAPLGTKIRIRYDLETYEEGIIVSVFKDIYRD